MFRQVSVLTALTVFLGVTLPSVAAGGSGMAAWWKLNETSGTTAADASGNGNDGALEGDGQWVEGVLDGAWEGDGTGDYIRVPHSDSLDISDAVTVALWLYGGIAPDQVLCKGNGGDAWVSSYSIRVDDDSAHSRQINWRGRGGTAVNGLNSASALPTDEWIHVAVTFDVDAAGDNQKIYLNGVLDAENQSSEPLSTNTDDVLIGADAYSTTRWHWQGMLDDIRIYNKALPAKQIVSVMAGGGLESASSPSPEDEATDVLRDTDLAWSPGEYAATHNVYLGTAFDDVNDANRDNPLDVLVSQDQTAMTYAPPTVLEYGQTYYWRVDEVNAAPDSTVFKGETWSFTVEPYAYAVENIVVTSNGTPDSGQIPENTINGSGLDENDQHSISSSDMWLARAGEETLYIQYEFDLIYKLYEMLVWNYNTQWESFLGMGLKDITIEYSLDGADWIALGDYEFAQAPGASTYTANTTIEFGGVAVKYVRLTVHSSYGSSGSYGLSEVRFLHIPVQARLPEPVDGASEVGIDATLQWRPGREAASHEVYVSADEAAVAEGTALVDVVAEASSTPGDLDLETTYYWKVAEVNEAEAISTWAGWVWSFTTESFIVVDDFESYNDEDNVIYETWIDGWTNGTGSTVGYLTEPFAETSIVHGGRQSMPLAYDNTETSTSQADLALAEPQDWTRSGVGTLTLYFQGDADNSTGQLYAEINGTRADYAGDATALTATEWQQWDIDLAALGANLTNVTTLSIGIEGGGTGMLYIDDIRLYR